MMENIREWSLPWGHSFDRRVKYSRQERQTTETESDTTISAKSK